VKVAYFHHSGDLYGSSKSLLYLLCEIQKRGVSSIVILAEDGPFHQVLKNKGFEVKLVEEIPVVRRKVFRTLADFLTFVHGFTRSYPKIQQILSDNDIDIVHSNDIVIGILPGLLSVLRKTPHVWHIRSNIGEIRIFTCLTRWLVLSLSTLLIGVSKSVVRQFDTSRSAKVRLVYNGLPHEVIDRRLPYDADFRSRHGFAADDLVVCCVGRINGWKGQGFLAGAFASIQHELPDTVKLLFVGDAYPGSEFYQSQLDDEIRRLGIGHRTVHISFVTDIRSVYEAIDILVVPSVVPEPFCLVVVEGMAYNCPIIAADHGGPSEILQDQVTGLLYAPDDLQGLAQRIKQLVFDDGLRTQLGHDARTFMETAFSITETADKVYDIYQSCLSK
jgi:glycosyltransferase involved in cell wall biosynthesis